MKMRRSVIKITRAGFTGPAFEDALIAFTKGLLFAGLLFAGLLFAGMLFAGLLFAGLLLLNMFAGLLFAALLLDGSLKGTRLLTNVFAPFTAAFAVLFILDATFATAPVSVFAAFVAAFFTFVKTPFSSFFGVLDMSLYR
jgi:hypothetical protein